jgi:hypothetical protein
VDPESLIVDPESLIVDPESLIVDPESLIVHPESPIADPESRITAEIRAAASRSVSSSASTKPRVDIATAARVALFPS